MVLFRVCICNIILWIPLSFTSDIISNSQCILVGFIIYSKVIIFCKDVLKIHTETITSRTGQLMDFIQSQPEFTSKVTKTIFIVLPTSIEVNRAILSSLDNCPSTTICFLITIELNTLMISKQL